MSQDHKRLESKWQNLWDQKQCFKAENVSKKPKYYVLDMFPYPSGYGLHLGHLASYTPTDIVARYKMARGFNVLHPMGYDAFGLPAEQYAIQTGIHPAETTHKAIQNFKRQLKSFGFSYDWSREVSTCEPDYYKWTQFIFLKLFEKGLAYQKEVAVNWCPELKTVLANEEVVDGKSERGGHPVIRRPMKQWMLKITDYAERLLRDLDKVDWPERTKEGQRNWIGKSEGARMHFQVSESASTFEIFTTRPDTIFGVTFMVLAPEHPLVAGITPAAYKKQVQDYVAQASSKSEVDRKAAAQKTGVFTGAYAVNPLSNQKIPIWIADYVLMDYGTGAIMAVPGHDSRDFEFATQFNLPVVRVLESASELPFEGDGKLVNSDFLNGLEKSEAIANVVQFIESQGIGKREIQYKLRDWLFSRQRYWGEPFPIVNKNGVVMGVDPSELPVTLPEVANYEPSEKGEAPLARVKEFVEYKSPKDGSIGIRETDTMPGSAGSSWYFLRYTDPTNSLAPFSKEAQKYWMPVDLYIGGPEHTVGHLLYARFWQKVLFDVGLVDNDEPFQKLAHQGVVMGPDGQRMSKSRGNVIDADEACAKFGADAARVYVSFVGPFDKDKACSVNGIEGSRRFLDRVWRLCVDDQGKDATRTDAVISKDLEVLYHRTVKKVGEDIESLNFNTAISSMMILVNEIYKEDTRPREFLRGLVQLLAPFAPHTCEEIWEVMGGSGFVFQAAWPAYDPTKTVTETITLAVQVNGKTRGTIEISLNAEEAEAVALAKQLKSVENALKESNLTKVIYKPGKILNLIAK